MGSMAPNHNVAWLHFDLLLLNEKSASSNSPFTTKREQKAHEVVDNSRTYSLNKKSLMLSFSVLFEMFGGKNGINALRRQFCSIMNNYTSIHLLFPQLTCSTHRWERRLLKRFVTKRLPSVRRDEQKATHSSGKALSQPYGEPKDSKYQTIGIFQVYEHENCWKAPTTTTPLK